MPTLGYEVGTKPPKPVVLSDAARRQGTYVVGTTGTGKTTLLEGIAVQDMEDPVRPGLCVLDPHGDFIEHLLLLVPEERKDDVILFAPGNKDQFEQPLGLNILSCDREDPRQVRRVTSTVIDTLYKLFSYSWGPRMEDLLRHSILTLMDTPDATLLDLLLLLASPEHRERYTGVPSWEKRKKRGKNAPPVKSWLRDPVVRHFWEVQMAGLDPRTLVEVTGSSLNKIGRFLSDPLLRNIVAQPKSAFNMREIMDRGKILLVNLSKGDLGEDNSALLGAVLVNQVLIAALQRREIPVANRRPFHLIVDEYQSFATATFPTLQSEARKYAIDVIVAHQYRDQLDELNQGSTLNVANFITLRVTGRDSFELAGQFDNTPPAAEKQMQPLYQERRRDSTTSETLYEERQSMGGGRVYRELDGPRRSYSDVQSERANHLANLAGWRAMCRLVDRSELVEKLVAIEPIDRSEQREIANYIRRQSLELGRPRIEVEAEIRVKIGGELRFDPPIVEVEDVA